MAYIFQSSGLLNKAVKQIWGQDESTVLDTGELVTLGQKVISSQSNKEQFMGVLADRIQSTVVRTLDLSIEFPNFMMDETVFLGLLQKINIAPLLTADDNSWNIGDEDYSTTIWEINKPVVSQTFFQNTSTFTIPLTIPDIMLRSAFMSTRDMDGFIAAVFTAVEQSMIMFINTGAHLALCNLIAENIKAGREINLLTMFNQQFGTTYTADKAIYSKDFCQYAGMIIRNYTKYMSNPSYLFNDGTELRATLRDNMHVIMLTDFVSAYTTYFTNTTFYKEVVSLPLYQEVTYWQNMGDDGSTINFKTNSTINIIPASEKEDDNPATVNQSYIICALLDRQSIGTIMTENWGGVDRNNRERYSNYTFGANRGYFNDLSENNVVFVIK